MNIGQKLEALCRDHPGCSLAAFGDLRTRLVFRSSGSKTCPQEVLDQVCAQAASGYKTADALSEQTDPEQGLDLIFLSPREMRVVVRADRQGSDFICCLCEPTVDASAIAADARDILQHMEQKP